MNINNKEIKIFKSEVKQLLNLMINSLYSNKEIFIRELISNASDAIDKLRFNSLLSPNLYISNDYLRIRILIDFNENSITISDNGIGMNKHEIIENLGTIAKSGTKDFLKSMNNKNEKLIGQFGVGFYSSFIVAKKVSVHSRSFKENSSNAVYWESSGKGEYSICYLNKENIGTDVKLFLKEKEYNFINEKKICSIVKKYSDHISLPIEVLSLNDKDKENNFKNKWVQINKAQALWRRNKSEIKINEYLEFYKYITNDNNNPLYWKLNKVEGKYEYISLLYIPSKAPWNIWNKDYKNGLKLYINRIFIMDNADQFLPNYLRFIKGIIDSNDLQLNISREILQKNEFTKKLKISLTKKVIKMLETLSINDKNKYEIFWKEFGNIFKEGAAETFSNQDNFCKLLRFNSNKNNDLNKKISLDEYISNMKEDQNKIYYLTADSYISAKNSPHLEIFNSKEIEVLLLFDKIDEWMMNYIYKFKNKDFQSINKDGKYLEDITNNKDKKTDYVENNLESFLNKIKNILNDKIHDVRLTYRLINSPSVLTTKKDDMTTQMSKLMLSAGQNVPKLKYIFEINPNHKIIKKIMIINDENEFKTWIELIFDQALLLEVGYLEDTNKFIKNMNLLLSKEI